MRTNMSFFTIFLVNISLAQEAKKLDVYVEPEPVDLIDPFIGTGGHGHTFPGPTAPFGMVQLSPDTRLDGWDGCSGYHYSDSTIYGFSHTHLSGTGISDYGDVLIMPTNTNKLGDYASPFKKPYEYAGAGYYSVELDKPEVLAELTTTLRTGIHSYTYKNPAAPGFIVDVKHRDNLIDWDLKLVNDSTIEGYRVSDAWAKEQHIYFVIRTNQKIRLIWDQGELHHYRLANDTKSLIIQVGISAVDMDGARKNLETEFNGWNFSSYVTNLRNQWAKQMAKISTQGGSYQFRKKFYTALYHTMIAPNLFSDVDGRYRGTDMKIHKTDPNTPQYTVFSLWDTFRSAHPLYTIIEPERTKHFIQSMYRHYRDGGSLPMWELAGNYTGCMIGFHALSVIADAYSKGMISDENIQLYKDAMVKALNQDKLGLTEYNKYGYIPGDQEAESVSKTLEYAYNNWCLATCFSNDTSFSNLYYKRAGAYKNSFDPSSGFMTPRVNGKWISTFDPFEVNFHYTEANAWQYNFFVPHDINGLIKLHGGSMIFERRLDSLFTVSSTLNGRQQADITGLIGQYSQGNEPDHHVPFLYYYLGKPYKTQDLVDGILDTLYTAEPDGLSGNEDCGQMSAWFVLSAIGLYPVLPGSDEMYILNPAFNSVAISDDFNNRLRIYRNGYGRYISSVNISGTDLSQPILKFQSRLNETVINIFTSDSSVNFPAIKDVGMTEKNELLANPTFVYDKSTFRKKLKVGLSHPNQQAKLYYTTDGSEPNPNSKRYKKPIKIKKTTTIKAKAFLSNQNTSFEEHARFVKNTSDYFINLESDYSNQYPAEGEQSLVDGIIGSDDFRTGAWQGFYDEDFSAVVDLGKKISVKNVEIRALEDIKSWIWLPDSVIIEYSDDGINFTTFKLMVNTQHGRMGNVLIKTFAFSDCDFKARYIRINAINHGPNPEGHPGEGDPTWLFFDEIIIK